APVGAAVDAVPHAWPAVRRRRRSAGLYDEAAGVLVLDGDAVGRREPAVVRGRATRGAGHRGWSVELRRVHGCGPPAPVASVLLLGVRRPTVLDGSVAAVLAVPGVGRPGRSATSGHRGRGRAADAAPGMGTRSTGCRPRRGWVRGALGGRVAAARGRRGDASDDLARRLRARSGMAGPR